MLRSLNFRISQKIMLLVAGLAAGFIAIGVAYFFQVNTEQSIQEQRAQLSANKTLLTEIRVDTIELNSLLQEFLASREAQHLVSAAEVKDDLMSKVDVLKQTSKQVGIQGDLASLEEVIARYDSAYQNTVTQIGRLGSLNEDGLLQQLKASGQGLMAELASGPMLKVAPDFMALMEQQATVWASPTKGNVEQLENLTNTMASQIQAVDAPQSLKNEALAQLDNYISSVALVSDAASKLQQAEANLNALGDSLSASIDTAESNLAEYTENFVSDTEKRSQLALAFFIGLSFAVVMAVAVGVFLIYKSIVFPMAHIQSVIRRINRGKLNARVRLLQKDELGDLGQAFNILLDERINTLEEQSRENEQLNNSIIALIRALGEIAQKNLTIKVPVSADITGTISDAVNLLTTETAKTLVQVKDISRQVNNISDHLQQQSSNVLRVAEDERKQVMATSKALDLAARAMNEIASRAESADKIAGKTIQDTQQAREAVMQSVSGILKIRETISETEKRIKRLGDRSQEISGIVNLINTIAERTHILALNASMHAASAGEAGKGFAVVADEVQRLAENAREATAEIAAMVNNIRVETSDTVHIMNKLITDVAQGTRLAEQAGQKMVVTEHATKQLVETVQAIAHSSIHQAQVSNKIRDRSNIIRNFTEKTGTELVQQKRHTDNLKHYADALLERVNVFALPESTEQSKSNVEQEDIKNVG